MPPKTAHRSRGRRPRRRPSRPRRSRRSSTASPRTSSRRHADWISGEVWVESDFDSDGDGKKDRLHADYTLPKETATDGLKVPVIYEDSPYYAGTAPSYSQLGRRPRARRHAARPPVRAVLQRHATRARRSPRSTSRPGSRAASPSCTPSRPGSGYSDGCPTSGGANETLGATDVIDWLNGRRKAYTTRTGDVEAAARQLAQRPHGDDGHVLQRHDPDRRRHHRRRRPRRDRPDLGDQRLVRLLPRQRHGARAALRRRRHRQQLATSARTSTCSSTTSTPAATRVNPPGRIDLPPG